MGRKRFIAWLGIAFSVIIVIICLFVYTNAFNSISTPSQQETDPVTGLNQNFSPPPTQAPVPSAGSSDYWSSDIRDHFRQSPEENPESTDSPSPSPTPNSNTYRIPITKYPVLPTPLYPYNSNRLPPTWRNP